MSNKKNIDKNPNILLVVIDALRADGVGVYNNKSKNSPNIDRLAEKGVVFKDAYSAWNSTDPSLTSILSGKYPMSHGIINHGELIDNSEINLFYKTGTKLLSEVLSKNGYQTMAVDWMSRWYKKGFDNYGYEVKTSLPARILNRLIKTPLLELKYILGHLDFLKCYKDETKRNIKLVSNDLMGVFKSFLFSRGIARIQNASYLTEAAKSMLGQRDDRQFFMMMHYWDTHMPYNCPRKYTNYKGKDASERLKDRYNGSIKYVDSQLGKLLEWMDKKGILENTMVIITSDHGESMDEHSILFDHHGLYENTLHVPLIISCPERFKAKEIGGFVQHIDLFPTILEMLGLEHTEYKIDGKTILPVLKGEKQALRDHVYSEESYDQRKRAIRTAEYNFITAMEGDSGMCRYCHKIHGGTKELYDLKSDAGENHNIYETSKEIADELEKRLNSIVSDILKRRKDVVESNKDNNQDSTDVYNEKEEKIVKQRLQMLGYLD